MFPLKNTIALVTGASRGVGKGIALGLAESQATVYITGRTVEEGKSPMGLPGTIHATAQEVNALGGRGIAVECDHTNDDQVAAVFARIRAEQGRLTSAMSSKGDTSMIVPSQNFAMSSGRVSLKDCEQTLPCSLG